MSEGVQLVLWIAGVHLIGFVAIVVLLLPALRENPGGPDDDGGDGWGGDGWGRGPSVDAPVRPRSPSGGIPLPDARPAAVRLRGPGRLADLRPGRERRPAREPQRSPVRSPGR